MSQKATAEWIDYLVCQLLRWSDLMVVRGIFVVCMKEMMNSYKVPI